MQDTSSALHELSQSVIFMQQLPLSEERQALRSMAFLTPSFLPLKQPVRNVVHPRRPRWSSCQDKNDISSHHSLDILLTKLRANPPACPLHPPPVQIVGTGPGDPGLLTLDALHQMQTADVVLYDRLITPSILRLVRPGALMIFVGKQSGFHTRTQEDIHLLLLFFASEGRRVIRLKGGDPLLYGRGGEEAAFLAAAGVSVSCTPGITAAAGVAAELGIPLTCRGVADSVRFMSGHASEGREVEIGAMESETTYVVYMGLGQMRMIMNGMMAGGLGSGMAGVAVERGTTETQRVVCGELSELCDKVDAAELKSPVLFIIGDVVRLGCVWGIDGVFEGRVRNNDMPHFSMDEKFIGYAMNISKTLQHDKVGRQ